MKGPKHFLYLLLAVLLSLNTACKKDDDGTVITEPPFVEDIPNGTAQSYTNDVLWEYVGFISPSSVYANKVSIVLNYYNESNFLRGQFHFRYFDKKIGTYYPGNSEYAFGTPNDSLFTCSFGTAIDDGDVVGNNYVFPYDSAMVFTVDQIDGDGTITGTFDGIMVRDTLYEQYDFNTPDTLVFSEGIYSAKLE